MIEAGFLDDAKSSGGELPAPITFIGGIHGVAKVDSPLKARGGSRACAALHVRLQAAGRKGQGVDGRHQGRNQYDQKFNQGGTHDR